MQITTAVLVATTACATATATTPQAWPWLDTSLTPQQRANALANEMNLTEKVTLMHGTGWGAGVYVGMTAPVERLGVPALRLNDGPQVGRFVVIFFL